MPGSDGSSFRACFGPGHEFRAAFAEAAAAAGIAQFVNRPDYPQGNGRVERSFLTDDLEFREVEDLATTADGLERQLALWNRIYEEIRPTSRLATSRRTSSMQNGSRSDGRHGRAVRDVLTHHRPFTCLLALCTLAPRSVAHSATYVR